MFSLIQDAAHRARFQDARKVAPIFWVRLASRRDVPSADQITHSRYDASKFPHLCVDFIQAVGLI